MAVYDATAGKSSATSTKATWWINFDLIEGVEAGLPMDGLNDRGERQAKGALREFYDWVMSQFKDIPVNTRVPIEINGRKFILWHGDSSQGTDKLDKSKWTCKLI